METEILQGFNTRFLPNLPVEAQASLRAGLHRCRIRFEHPRARSEARVPAGNILEQLQQIGQRSSSCDNGSTLFDHYDEDRGNVTVSPAAVVYGGVGVVAHEFGHCIQHLTEAPNFSPVTRSRLARLDQCLVGMHGRNSHFKFEDFADWFAATIIPRPLDVGCVLTAFRGSTPPYDSEMSDTHSSDLFRSLHMARVQNRALPAPCTQLLEHKTEVPAACGL